MNHTPEPWQHIWKHDTHRVARDPKGRMKGTVTLALDDYDRALACVNGCAGLDPAAYAAVVKALGSVLEFCHAALDGTVHDDNLRYYERMAYAALDQAEYYRLGHRAEEISDVPTH
jgi:hypothetical protein